MRLRVAIAVAVMLGAAGCAHKPAKQVRVFLDKKCVLGYWIPKNGCTTRKDGNLVCDGVIVDQKDVACYKVATGK